MMLLLVLLLEVMLQEGFTKKTVDRWRGEGFVNSVEDLVFRRIDFIFCHWRTYNPDGAYHIASIS